MLQNNWLGIVSIICYNSENLIDAVKEGLEITT